MAGYVPATLQFRLEELPVEEIWKDIEGYEGLYQVSNLGNVRSLNFRGKGFAQNLRAKRMAEYLGVCLCKDKKHKYLYVHRLVAFHFVNGYQDGLTVNHLNENKWDNRAENLEWCTQKENDLYGTGRERSNRSHKKPVEQIGANGETVRVFGGASETEEAGFRPSLVTACCRGQAKTHGGYEWRYAT